MAKLQFEASFHQQIKTRRGGLYLLINKACVYSQDPSYGYWICFVPFSPCLISFYIPSPIMWINSNLCAIFLSKGTFFIIVIVFFFAPVSLWTDQLWILLFALLRGFELMRFENFVDLSLTFHLFLIVIHHFFASVSIYMLFVKRFVMKSARNGPAAFNKFEWNDSYYIFSCLYVLSSLFAAHYLWQLPRKMRELEKRNHAAMHEIDRNNIEYLVWIFRLNVQWKENYYYFHVNKMQWEKKCLDTQSKIKRKVGKKERKKRICVFDFGWPSPSPDRLLNIPSKMLVI